MADPSLITLRQGEAGPADIKLYPLLAVTVNLTGLAASAQQGTLTNVMGVSLVGQQANSRNGHFSGLKNGANVVVFLDGLQAVAGSGVFQVGITLGATGAQSITPAVVQSAFTGSGGDYFPPMEITSWATENNFIAYDGVLLGVGDNGYKAVSGDFSMKRRFGYSLDQTTRDKVWGHAPWTVASWDAPGDAIALDAFFGGTGIKSAGGIFYDFAGPHYSHGGQFSLDLDGNQHFVHTRGYGRTDGRQHTTPDIVLYYQVSDIAQKVFNRENFPLDARHELTMGVYGHRQDNALIFYPTFLNGQWVPTYRRWNGATLEAEVQLLIDPYVIVLRAGEVASKDIKLRAPQIASSGDVDAQHRNFCVARAGYDDTIYVTYLSNKLPSGQTEIGLIVMDAVTLTVFSHKLYATVVNPDVIFESLSSDGTNINTRTTHRSLAEVVQLSSGASVTQFLMSNQFVHLSWTSATTTTPTLTVKAGPVVDGLYLIGGWESLEVKGDEVYHVVYHHILDSSAFNPGTGLYDYVQSFQLYSNSAVTSENVWSIAPSPLWTWTESFSLNQLSYVWSLWFSGYGDGGQTLLYSAPAMACGAIDSSLQARLVWLDYWAGQQPFMSVKAKGRVGHVTITIVPGITLTGIPTTISGGVFTPGIAVTLTGLVSTATAGTLGGVIPQDATVALTGLSMSVAQGLLATDIGPVMTGLAATSVGGVFTPTNKPVLVGNLLATSRGTLLPTITVALTGLQASAQSGALAVTCGANLTGQSLTTTSGVIVPTLAVRLIGARLQTGYGIFIPLNSPLLVGAVMAALEGSLQVAVAVPLAGSQATTTSGTLGFLYDCNLFPTGVEAIFLVSPDPTLTNVPFIGKNLHLWARAEVQKLFSQVSPDELFNDAEPRE